MKKKKAHSIFLWITGSTVGLVLLLQSLLFFLGDEILRESILVAFREYAKARFHPERMPELDFGELRLNLLGGTIGVTDLAYHSGLPISNDLKDPQTNYRISVPTLSVSGLHLWEVYRSSQIQLEEIYLESPEIIAVQVVDTSKTGDTSEDEQLQQVIREQETQIYNAVREYVDLFSFDKLEIANASFFLDKRTTPVAEIDTLTAQQSDWFAHRVTIVLQNFWIDSTVRQEKSRLLFTEDIQVKLGDYRVVLPDSSYAVVADTLSFSTQKKALTFQNLELKPLRVQDSAQWYSLTVPLLEMTDIDLLEIYREKTISVDTLLLKFPQIKGYSRVAASSEKESERSLSHLSRVHPDTLYALISEQWKRISINQFSLTDGQLQFFQVDTDTVSWLDVPQYSLSFNDFQLDSTVSQRKVDSLSHVLPMDSIDGEGKNIRIWFADFQHYFTVDQFSIQTNRQARYACNLVFDSARVQPRVDSLALFLIDSQPPNLGYDIRTSQVKIFGIDLENLSFTKFADIDSIWVSQPEVAIANFSDTPFGNLPRQISPAATDTSDITIKQIFYNWSHARLNLYPVIAPNRTNAWLEQMLVKMLNLDHGHVEIMNMNNRKDGFTKIAHVDKFRGYYENVSIGNEAHPLIAIDDVVRYSSQVAVFADEVDMTMKGSWFQFPYNRASAVSGGWLEAEEVGLSTLGAKGYVQDVRFWPNRRAVRSSPTQMEQMEIPYFAIEGINFGELYNLQVAKLDRISLISPTISMKVGEGQRSRNSDFSMPELYLQVEPYLDQLAVNKLEIQQAAITLRSDDDDPQVRFSTTSLDVSIIDFLLDRVTTVIPERPFYAQEARIAMGKFDFSLPVDEEDENFTAERFLYSSYSDRLTIDNLLLVEDSVDAADNTTDLQVTQLALHRMNFFRYFTKNEMEVEKVIVRRPNVSIATKKGQAKRSTKPGRVLQAEIYPKIKSVTEGIYVNQLSVEEGVFSYVQTDSDTLHYIQADTLLLNAYQLAIDSLSQQQQAKMLFADKLNFNIHISDYLLRLPEAHQSIQAKEVVLSNQDERISVSDLAIKPYGFQATNFSDYPQQNLVSLATPSLHIVDLDVEKMFTQGELDVERVNIMNPAIEVYQFGKDSSASSSSPLAWSEIASPYLEAYNIDNINFTNGTVTIYQNQDDDRPAFGAERVDLSLIGLQVDSLAYHQFITKPSEQDSRKNITRKLLLADDLLVRVHDYQLALSDTLYTAKADQISLSTKNPELKISGFVLAPRVPRYLYKKVFPLQKTRVAAQIETIRFNDIDFEELIKQRHLHAHSLILDDIQIDAFKDARVPRNHERTLPMHQEMLLDLDFLLTLDTIQVTNGFINYAERVPDASQDGIITFEQFNALLTNATNHPDRLKDSVVFTMTAKTQVMGQGDLKVSFRFPMTDKDMSFTVNGELDSMDLKAINPILEHSAFVHIREGQANSMRFYVQGNRDRSTGELRFNYNDLNILLVDKNKGRPGLDERVGSLIANAFVVKADNPKAIFFRVGEIEHERDPSRSIFSYWWRSLLSGIKSSIGMQPVAERVREETMVE
ncbi:DUF748 domain-containing protein [Tunicatimonas pelagia]|uniref:DUF748 domain-containing protein n=1 Tax=Tunicatimonas pelagia TaxID=931531 RepID=UPI002665EB51|nr:DUF748 domain-containing protein [Tunicatimonas pelagia]WKN43957.1 DUF748 domain-containing protein [Tunicatimonas pelagia]